MERRKRGEGGAPSLRGAGRSVGVTTHADRATLFLEKSSSKVYNYITNRNFGRSQRKIWARRRRAVWRKQEFCILGAGEFGGWAWVQEMRRERTILFSQKI